jgi:hypothetical protein
LRRAVVAFAGASVLLAGGAAACERIGSNNPCSATMERGDDGTHVIHLPDGSMVLSEAQFSGGNVKVSAGDFSMSDFVHTVPADKVKAHPTLSYDASSKVELKFHVSEDSVTTSCSPLSSSKQFAKTRQKRYN